MPEPAASPQVRSGATHRVSVRGVTKRFRTRSREHVALDNVSLDVEAGEFLVLLGPSGCGKTTLLRCVAGLETPDEGEILVNGNVVFSSKRGIWLPPEKRRLSMVFQSYALWPHMTIFENVAYPLRNLGQKGAGVESAVMDVLRIVGLDHVARSYPGQLSGGQQQRVALARAIVWKADLVLFDEPLSNLDAKVRERLRVELLNLQSQLHFSALYVTHDQTEAMALADRIVVMGEGRIVQLGKPADIYAAPRSRYVADFVGSTNEIAGTIVAREGANIEADTPLGRIAGVAGNDEALDIGQAVTIVFRPQHCRRDNQGGAANVLRGKLAHTQFLGAQIDRLVDVGGHILTITDPAEDDLPTGADMTIFVARDRVRIFADRRREADGQAV